MNLNEVTFDTLRTSRLVWRAASWRGTPGVACLRIAQGYDARRRSYDRVDLFLAEREMGDVSGGISLFPNAWRLVTTFPDRERTIAPFDRFEDAESARESAPVNGWHRQWIEPPNDYVDEKKVRLPVYGHASPDHLELRDDRRFGRWLTRGQSIRRHITLIDFIDAHEDPAHITVGEVERLLMPGGLPSPMPADDLREALEVALPDSVEWRDHDDDRVGYDDPDTKHAARFQSETGYPLELVQEALAVAVEEWLGTVSVEPASATHQCRIVLSPMKWPERAGVYFVLSGDRIKIGKASHVAKRLTDLGTSSPHPLQLLAVAPGGLAEEAVYHKRFATHRRQREWFEPHEDIVRECARLRAADGES